MTTYKTPRIKKDVFNIEFWKHRLKITKSLKQAVHNTDEETWKLTTKSHTEILKKLIQPEDKILDAGCCWGRVIEILPEDYDLSGYLGIDFSPEFIGIAKRRYPDVWFMEADLRHLDSVLDPKHKFNWAILGSMRGMIQGNIGEEVWNGIETSLRKYCTQLLYLEYHSEEISYWNELNGSVE